MYHGVASWTVEDAFGGAAAYMMVVGGGTHQGDCTNSTFVYTTTNMTWNRRADLSQPRNSPAASVYASDLFAPGQATVYVVGGINLHTKTVINVVEAWDYVENAWKLVSSVPSVVTASAAGTRPPNALAPLPFTDLTQQPNECHKPYCNVCSECPSRFCSHFIAKIARH